MADSIAEIINNIKTAAAARKDSAVFPLSKKILPIVQAIERAGFLEILPKKGKKFQKQIETKLVYLDGSPVFKGGRRISNLSKRFYVKIKNVTPVRNGHGILMMSTAKGVLTNKEARNENVGGEALFEIWR